jgi:hypothetical protein
VELKVEASEVVAEVRTSQPSFSAEIYVMLRDGHIGVSQMEDAIGCFNTGIPIYEEVQKEELAVNCYKTKDRHGFSATYNNLATCYQNTGYFEKALVL